MAAATALRQMPAMAGPSKHFAVSATGSTDPTASPPRRAAHAAVSNTPSPRPPSRRTSLSPKTSTASFATESAPTVPSDALSHGSSSVTPSQSASQAARQSDEGRRRKASANRAAHRHAAISADPLSYHNLAMASATLSTPELHLSSDPLESNSGAFAPRPALAALSGSQEGMHGRTLSSDAVPLAGSDAKFFSSLAAVMGSVTESKKKPLSPGAASEQPTASKRGRTQSNATIRKENAWPSRSKDGDGNLADPDVRRPGSSDGDKEALRRDASVRHPSTWFRRQPKRSTASSTAPPTSASSDSNASLSTATAGSGTTMFTEGGVAPSNAPASSLGVDAPLLSTPGAHENLRTARAFMVSELGQLSPQQMGDDKARLASLAWFTRAEQAAQAKGVTVDVRREMLEFWLSISDGVLLCLLANRLRPGCIENIDRRDLEWVKTDNISRFLRAARDHFGVRSKDLFHPLDLTDATSEGLLRAVHTILALRREVKLRGVFVGTPLPPALERRSSSSASQQRTSMHTPPLTPDSSRETVSAAVPFPRAEGDGTASPNGSPGRRESKHRHAVSLSVQQQRQEAERKLVATAAASPPPLAVEPHVASRRRRSSEAGGSLLSATRPPKSASITFADSLGRNSSDEEGGRMPYRDRKLSESAVSLKGVQEEEGEEVLSTPISPRNKVFTSSLNSNEELSTDADENNLVRSRSPNGTRLGGHSPMARSSSQRRISQELGLAVVPPSGSSNPAPGPRSPYSPLSASPELDDSRYFQASPSRQGPVRRHSTRASSSAAGPSSLNPRRDSFSASESASSRVPFPRSASSAGGPNACADSPSVQRVSRHLSLNTGSSLPSDVSSALMTSANSSSGGMQLSSSPRTGGARPNYRHLRYSSDLHIPRTPHSGPGGPRSDVASDDRSMTPVARSRYDSEMGSLYTNTLGSLTNDDLSTSTRVQRESTGGRALKHQLVVVEDGKPNVTFQMGNCIGRGQFGSVYRALNLNTGQMVAVKRIKLEGRSEDEVTQLMNEVDLLKSLAHPSVVKYEGLVRGNDVLSIILEYVENGSLLHTLKAFGNFPEKLVASYVVKILEGLNYLHEMKVVHCDLKAANILTTKNGNVKLSDFGVSLNLKAVKAIQDVKNDAIGTPNWMAPEVILLQGASTSADIWSLGCTIIELLTGKPPYGNIPPLSAMWRIVEDDRPPLPEKISDSLRDFLLLCFNKDPELRPSAEQLFEHEWLANTWSGHKAVRPQDSVPFLKRISADFRRVDLKGLHAGVEAVAEGKEPQSPSVEDRRPSDAATSVVSPRDSLDLRPPLIQMRAASNPEGWSPGIIPKPESESHDSQAMGRRPSDTPSAMMQDLVMRSPSMMASSSGERSTGPHDVSLLDLNWAESLRPAEPVKPHAFVKSTFSKAVRCKICREPVKKHAVLCEECGLICHASCTQRATTPCNLRAQLIMLAGGDAGAAMAAAAGAPIPMATSLMPPRQSLDRASMSSQDLPSTVQQAASFAPVFRLPFGKGKRNSKQSLELPSSPPITPTTMGPLDSSGRLSPTATPSSAGDKTTPQGHRRRRISLLPRQRSPSPSPAMEHSVSMSRSISSSNSFGERARRGSSFGFGSVSGSSSISSKSQTDALGGAKGKAGGPSAGQSTQAAKVSSGAAESTGAGEHGMVSAAISAPHLLLDGSGKNEAAEGAKEKQRRYRLSTGLPFGQSDAALVSKRNQEQREAGAITPRANNKDRRSRRMSNKGDCVVQ